MFPKFLIHKENKNIIILATSLNKENASYSGYIFDKENPIDFGEFYEYSFDSSYKDINNFKNIVFYSDFIVKLLSIKNYSKTQISVKNFISKVLHYIIDLEENNIEFKKDITFSFTNGIFSSDWFSIRVNNINSIFKEKYSNKTIIRYQNSDIPSEENLSDTEFDFLQKVLKGEVNEAI